VAANRDYWLRFITETLGPTAANAQTAEAACEFIERIDLKGDWSGFGGNRSFADDAAARKAFALLRCHQARIYAERAKQAGAGEDASALNAEAGRAFREAWLLWPADDPSTWTHAAPAKLYPEFLLEQKDQVSADRVQQTVNALQRPAVFLLPPED
jgi:hypothetical protein